MVETSFRVPGLGVLVLPAPPAPAWLAAVPLHAALSLEATGLLPAATIAGTVEELARDDQPPRRALLLDFDPGGPLPAGTRLRARAAEPPALL